jgi:hypothetical protein
LLEQIEIVAHPDFVAVADHRRARQRAHQAVGEFESSAITPKHGRKATPDALVVQLRILVGAEVFENHGLLRLGQSPEIELVVIAQE